MRRVSIVAHPRANAGEFVGGNAGADAAPANQHAPFSLAIEHGAAHGFGKIWVVRWVFIESPDIQYVVAHRSQQVAHGVLELKARVVRTNHNLHVRLTFRGLPWLRRRRSRLQTRIS